jgi:hypothetical protein
MWAWIKRLFKKKNQIELPKESNSSTSSNSSNSPETPDSSPVVVKPVEPIPEIPPVVVVPSVETPEAIEDFFFADISHYIEKFDPKLYTPKVLIHKTTQGLSMVDARYTERKALCKSNNILYLGYHFFECYSKGADQAAHYFKNHGSFDSLPILDFESIPGKKGMEFADFVKDQENAYACLKEIQRLTGKTPIIYANRLEIENMKLPAKWGEFYWWFSRYNSFLGAIPAPADPRKVLGWQYKEVDKNYTSYPSSFAGIGNCDCNKYYGNNNVLNLK